MRNSSPPPSLVSPSLRRESHMAPRLNGSVALDRLSAPAGLSGPAVMGERAGEREAELIELSCLSSHFLGLPCLLL